MVAGTHGLRAAVVILCALRLLQGSARARDPEQRRIEELEQKVLILTHKAELAAAKAAEDAKKGVTVTAAPGQGLTVTTKDERFQANWRMRTQIRDTVVTGGTLPTTNEIGVRTVRLIVNGYVLRPELRYVVQLAFGPGEFESGNPSPIFDAFVEYTRLRDLSLRFGQYFVPFDRARTIREFALQFVDRQQPVQELTLDRDVGLTLFSNDLGGAKGILGYYLGIFAGEGRNRLIGQGPTFLYVARFVVKPWGNFDDDMEGDLLRLPRPRLAIGVAGAFNQNTSRARSTTGNTFTLGGFDYLHGAADLVFKHSGFSFLGEVLVRNALSNNRMGLDANMMPLTEWSRSGWGYFLQAGAMLGGYVEVVARWDQLFALGLTDPALTRAVDDLGRQVGGGLNLYLNGHFFKLQADYFYSFGNVVDQGRHQVRVQLDATF